MGGGYKNFAQSRGDGRASVRNQVSRQGDNLAPDTMGTAPFGTIFDQRQLQPFHRTLDDGLTPEQARKVPQASFNPGQYADMQQQQVALLDGVDKLVLSRSRSTRIFLLIFNPNAANLYFAWDQVASASSIPIPPGGNLFFDNAVPQNDLHLFYAGANVNVPFQYMTNDIANAAT